MLTNYLVYKQTRTRRRVLLWGVFLGIAGVTALREWLDVPTAVVIATRVALGALALLAVMIERRARARVSRDMIERFTPGLRQNGIRPRVP